MAVVNGNGISNLGVWGVLSTTFTVTSFSDTGFVATNANGTVTATGFGLTYSSTPGPGGTALVATTGGTVTGVSYSSGSSQQTWTGVSVSGAAASNAIASGVMTNFNNLFFSGDDTFNFVSGTNTGLFGYDGNDVFNISNWNGGTSVDGGTGTDTLNITGGVPYTGITSNFSVSNVERVNLFNGTYQLFPVVGFSGIVDGSALVTNLFWGGGNNAPITVIGGAGNDTFRPGGGPNVFNGGGGTNTLDLTFAGTFGPPTTVDLRITGSQSLGFGATTLTLSNIQNIIGRGNDDILTGDNGDNAIDGEGGSDTINGLGGNDIIYVGNQFASSPTNHTTVDGGTGTDTVVFVGALASYTIGQSNGAVTFTSGGLGVFSLTNVESARFSDQTLSLSGPTVITGNISTTRNQTFAASSLFSAAGLGGLPITTYRLLDTTTDPLSGNFVLNSVVQTAGTPIDITPGQLSQLSFVTGRAPDTLQVLAFDGVNWSPASQFTITPFNYHPDVITSNKSATHGQVFALSSLFSTSDVEGDPITKYQLWDGTADPLSGHFAINGVAQPERAVIDITAAQVGQVTFVAGMISDNFVQIRAFDGVTWSLPDTLRWSPFDINVAANNAPVVSTADKAAAHGQSFALSSLFSVSDADNDTITRYQLWDGTADPNSGHFVINGVAQPERAVIDITAAQVAQTSFIAGTVSDSLIQIRAFDGLDWSQTAAVRWAPFDINVATNHAPVLTTTNKSATFGQVFALSSLFSVSDADGDTITRYQLWDATADPLSGHFVINGQAQPERTVIDITAAQVAQTSFVAGSAVSDNLIQIRAFDGADWSQTDAVRWAPFDINVPVNNLPVVTTADKAATHGQTFALSSLFSVTDADNDTITKYQLWDGTADPLSGHFVINGVAQPERAVIDITAAQVAQTSFVAGMVSDNFVQIRAFDGHEWSQTDAVRWAPFNINVAANNTPVVSTANKSATHGQVYALSSLFSVSDADNDTITRYQLWDGTADPLSGHFVINGVVQAERTVIDITAAQVAQTSFVAGLSVSDNFVQIRAFDGLDWSQTAAVRWAPFDVTVPPNTPPVVTTADKAATHGQVFALSSLFSVSDGENDTITRYQLWDGTADPLSGHFVINGVAQPERAVIDITAAQVAQTSFVAGVMGDSFVQIRAFDGLDWSQTPAVRWAPFNITVPPNTAPVVSTVDKSLTHGSTVTLSSLFSVNDADSDTITAYEIWDATADPLSGHFIVNGAPQPERAVIDLTPGQLGQTNFLVGAVGHDDDLQIRAFDGYAWSQAFDVRWNPFHVTAT